MDIILGLVIDRVVCTEKKLSSTIIRPYCTMNETIKTIDVDAKLGLYTM